MNNRVPDQLASFTEDSVTTVSGKPSTTPISTSITPYEPAFQSFWMGGFESACHINSWGCRLDMIALTQHDRCANEDYGLLRSVDILAARDGVRWHLIEETPGHYDFTSLQPLVDAARRHRIQVIWNLCHYGWPDHLDLFSPEFPERFAAFARATARYIIDRSEIPPAFAPINEISFFAWAIGNGGFMFPYSRGRGDDVKRQLVRSAILAIDAIREIAPRIRFVQPDPIIRVVAPRDRPDLAEAAAHQHEAQFHAWDMLAGRIEPELGGRAEYLDIIGVNYYHSNQFEHPDVRLRWEDSPRDERFLPFSELVAEVYQRYQRPMIVSETSHFGIGRAAWLREMAQEARLICERGIPLLGVCLYPIIDRPDWENFDHWHNSGLWDLISDGEGCLKRTLNEEYAQELRRSQALLAVCGRI